MPGKDGIPEFDDRQQTIFDTTLTSRINKAKENMRAEVLAEVRAEFDAVQAKVKEDSDEAALVANQKWQELAAKHEARVKELEPLEAKGKAYEAIIAGMLKDRIKALGDAAEKAVAGLPDSLTTLEKLGWLTENEALFQATGDGVGTPGSKRVPKNKQSAENVGHRRLRM